MRIYITDTNEVRDITMKAWKDGNWSPDMFADIADTTPQDFPISEEDKTAHDASAAMTSREFSELVEWWATEVEKYNNRDGSSWFFENGDPDSVDDELALNWETVR